jgi:argininosuccinate lyase
MSISGYQARLSERPAPELVRAAYEREIGDAEILWPGLELADIAHVVVLVEGGVVPAAAGAALLRGLLELQALPLSEFPLDPALEDVASNREAWLRNRDADSAGWLGAGRARREPATVAYRVAVRSRLLDTIEAAWDLHDALVELADAHVATIMPDYTYLQQAQPTSLAHYLLSFASPLGRDVERLSAAFERTNRSPAGIGSINGSRLAIDRRRLAELLGFDDVIANTRDAMWQADGPVEVMAAVVTLALSADRLAEDLLVWNTAEFGLVDLADRHARVSFIMPQKKNPYSLAFVRGMTADLMGTMVTMTAIAKTPSAQVDNRIFALGAVPRALAGARDTVRLLASVLRGLRVDTRRMAARARESWAYATDLAEVVMQHAGLSYRAAHRVLGAAVRAAVDRGVSPQDLSPAHLDEASRAVLGRPLEIPAAALAAAADPAAIVSTRTGVGGAAPGPVREMLRERRERARAGRTWLETTRARLEAAERRLFARAQELADG